MFLQCLSEFALCEQVTLWVSVWNKVYDYTDNTNKWLLLNKHCLEPAQCLNCNYLFSIFNFALFHVLTGDAAFGNCITLQCYLIWVLFSVKIARKQCCGSGSEGSVCFWASRIRIQIRLPQVQIRLRIRILPSSSKKPLISTAWDFFMTYHLWRIM